MFLSVTKKNNCLYSASLAICLTFSVSGCGGDKGKSPVKSSSTSSSAFPVYSSNSTERIASSSLSSSTLSSFVSSSTQSSVTELKLKTIRVWPVGDSITVGASNNWGIWSPINAGYRRNLMLLLNDGYYYEFVGGDNYEAPGGDLPSLHSGYGGHGLTVLDKPEFTPEKIKENNPDAVLLMLGINSIGSKKEYPDAQGQYWSANGNRFNKFFISYKAFIERVLNNSNNSIMFIAKIPPISDTRFYQAVWDDAIAPSPIGWNTVGDGTVNPKDVVKEFNTELQALYDTYFANNPRVVLVDMNAGFTVGDKWEDDVNIIGVPQNWWNGDGLHPTQNGYRHIAERWNTAIRTAIPTTRKLLYSVDCGAKEGAKSLASEGILEGSEQSATWDKSYGPDVRTGKNWGHIGDADYNGLVPKPANASLYFAWEGTNTVYESVATSTAGNNLVYHFEVPAGGTYRIFLGFHDTWGDNANPKGTMREAKIFIDGVLKGTKTYELNDFGRSIYEATNTSGTLEIKIEGVNGDALLDSIAIQRLK